MFATKHDAEKWIEHYGSNTRLIARKINGYWRILPLGQPLSELEIHQIEELHEMQEGK